MKRRKLRYIYSFIFFFVLLIVGSSCRKSSRREAEEGATMLSLNSLIKGAIDVGPGTTDTHVTRLIIYFFPYRPDPLVRVDVTTSDTNTQVQTDNTDPMNPITYITVGTKNKTTPTDIYEIILPYAGQYDILLIANPTAAVETDILNAKTRSAILDIFNAHNDYSDLGDDKYFGPNVRMMSRIYRNQTIGMGTATNPFEWSPTLHSSSDVFFPVSSFPEAYQEDDGTRVGLLRAMAKISVKIKALNSSCFTKYTPTNLKVTLHEVPKYYTLVETPWVQAPTSETHELVIYNKPWDGLTPVNVDPVYFPEKVFSATTPPDWVGNASVNGTLYFKVEITRVLTVGGTPAGFETIKLPLLTPTQAQMHQMTDPAVPPAERLKYLDLMVDRDADYNIYRNRHYIYNISMPWEIENETVTIGFSSTTIEEINFDVPPFY